jgi:hypothetical protein
MQIAECRFQISDFRMQNADWRAEKRIIISLKDIP